MFLYIKFIIYDIVNTCKSEESKKYRARPYRNIPFEDYEGSIINTHWLRSWKHKCIQGFKLEADHELAACQKIII